MVSYQALDTKFQKLNHEEKKEKIINILDFIKDKIDFASGMKAFVSDKKDISDQFLNTMYQVIMKTATETAEQQTDQKNKNMLHHISDIVLQHQVIESEERNAAENILEQI